MYGTLVVSTSPFWPKIIGDCGLDFIFIDTEHIAISRETLISILTIAFLGWFFGGMQIGMTNLINDTTKYLIIESGWSESLNTEQSNKLNSNWWAYMQCAFLFGAAAGGY